MCLDLTVLPPQQLEMRSKTFLNGLKAQSGAALRHPGVYGDRAALERPVWRSSPQSQLVMCAP